jgi:hypothetical protein
MLPHSANHAYVELGVSQCTNWVGAIAAVCRDRGNRLTIGGEAREGSSVVRGSSGGGHQWLGMDIELSSHAGTAALVPIVLSSTSS